MFALSGFVLLRKDRPNWPRPIKLGAIWAPIAGILAVWCLILTIVGFGYFQTAAGGYGGTKEKVIGIGVLVIGILLFFFRRIVQDKEQIHWREDTPRCRRRTRLDRRPRRLATPSLRPEGPRAAGPSGRQNRSMSTEAPPPEEFDVVLRGGFAPGALEGLGDSAFDDIPASEQIDVGDLEGDPAIAFRRTLGMFATGVTVLTTRVGEQVHGMTANAFMSVSLRPPLVLISLDRRTRMCGMLHEGSRYGVSVLARGQSDLSETYARRDAGRRRAGVRRRAGDAARRRCAGPSRCAGGADILGRRPLALPRPRRVRPLRGRRAAAVPRWALRAHAGRPELFSRLPRELLDQLLRHGHEVRFESGETLMSRGEVSDTLMLVMSGSVRVERPGRTLTLGPGALIGEIEVLDPGAGRMATITAETDTTCVVVTRSELLEGLAADPQAAIALLGILASRFRETGDRV